MKHIFIINKTSGKGSNKNIDQIIDTYCKSRHYDYQIFETERPGHATEIAHRYSIKDDVCIYSVGGDGTAFEIINGLNDKVPLAIIPSGTGNDYFRMISDSPKSIQQLLFDTIEGRNVNVDYGISNHNRFLNCTTMGLDAKVNDYVCTMLKKTILPKPMLYGISAFKNVFKPDTFHVRIETENQTIEQDSILVAVMNGKAYGNGVIPCKDTSIQDGCFDICIVDSEKPGKLLQLLPKYLNGKASEVRQCHFYKAKHIKIETDHDICMQSDGETFYDHYVVMDIMDKGLILRVPNYAKLK